MILNCDQGRYQVELYETEAIIWHLELTRAYYQSDLHVVDSSNLYSRIAVQVFKQVILQKIFALCVGRVRSLTRPCSCRIASHGFTCSQL